MIEIINMKNARYTVLVMPYLLGQYRIQITDLEQPDPWAPKGHGAIIVEA